MTLEVSDFSIVILKLLWFASMNKIVFAHFRYLLLQ